MKSKLGIATALALALLVAGCGGSSSDNDSSADEFRLGLEAPLSGELSVLGDGMLKGAELAAAQLNEDGGILGRQVEVVPIDDAGDRRPGSKPPRRRSTRGSTASSAPTTPASASRP